MRRMARLALLGLLLGAALAAGGCQEEAGRAPVARFDVSPSYVPFHDGYTTVVTLDGSRSKDEIDDPAGTLPLGFHWDLDDPAVQVVEGSLDAAQVKVKLQGDRPTSVTLSVWDSTRTGVRTGYVGVTVADPTDGGAGPVDSDVGAAPGAD